jgi:hypothetical protein
MAAASQSGVLGSGQLVSEFIALFDRSMNPTLTDLLEDVSSGARQEPCCAWFRDDPIVATAQSTIDRSKDSWCEDAP